MMTLTSNSFPWQQTVWQTLMHAWQQQRLPHALLLGGALGMGKLSLAHQLVSTLLCNNPSIDGIPCQHCKSCHLLRTHNHPDFTQIQALENSKQITVDQIRDLIQFCGLTSHYGGHQLAIIFPAEAMNRNAANSLLKLLEEPPPSTLLILISHRPMTLLPTVRSRCQLLNFNYPPSKLIRDWLQPQIPPTLDAQFLLNLTAQAPLAALQLGQQSEHLAQRQLLFETSYQLLIGQQEPLEIAEQWSKLDNLQTFKWLLSWTTDLIRFHLTLQTQFLTNQDQKTKIQHIAPQLNIQKLFKLLDLQNTAYQLLETGTNVKIQGLLDSIALTWSELQPTKS